MKSRIRQLREEYHMTQIRLSIELEVSQETISSYENGKHYPSVTALLKMSKIFNVSIDYILGISDTKVISASFDFKNIEANEFISNYQRLSAHQQNLVSAYMSGIIDSHEI